MNVVFVCSQCESPARADLSAPREWQCASCEQRLTLEKPDAALPRCVVCGNGDLYKKKNFPHWLGMTLLVGACLVSVFTYGWYEWWLTWSILIGTALFDGLLYLWVGDAVVCYRCQAHYTGVPAPVPHHPFELTLGERYRQERIRREQMKSGR